MATELNLEQKLADLLDTRDFHPEMLGKDGRPTDAENAKTFSFDYISGSGKNYGTMVVILGADNEMYIMYGDNLGKTIDDPEDRNEFFEFQQQLTDLANRNRWTATLTDISKLKRVQAGIAAIKEGLFEGYYGTRKISYAGEPTEARLMIKHNRTLGENDARFRYVESVFIETADGERFKLPYTNMTGARAMLEHVRQGGKPYDVRGNHICEMVSELKVLNRFNRAANSRVMEGVTQQIVEQAQKYYNQLRESLKHLGSGRGYQAYFESWHPLDVQEQESLVEDIKTMFIEQTLDTRIEAALPLLARIQQQGNTMKEADIFESWANRLVEGTWSLPETPEQMNKLKELMSKELIVGPDATNATEQLYDLVGDDQLYDQLSDIAKDNPGADVRWAVIDRLKEMGVDVAELEALESGKNQAPAAPAPVSEGRILDESGETLDHILNRFKHEVHRFEQGDDLDTDLYHALYDYYSDHGEIPYGVAKARDGDPFEWVTQRLDQELGTGNYTPRVTEADPVATFEADADSVFGEGSGCNSTMEGEYCPEHGLMECGSYMESIGGTVAGAVAPLEEGTEELYGLRVGDTVKATIDGKRVQGDVIDIFPDSMEVELLLRGANAGKTVTVDVRDTESMMEDSALDRRRNKLAADGYISTAADRLRDQELRRQDKEQRAEIWRQEREQNFQRSQAQSDAAADSMVNWERNRQQTDDARTKHEIDVLAHRLNRMQRDDDDWERTFDMMRDRINRYQYSTQRDVDPEQLAAISNIQYQPRRKKSDFVPTNESITGAVDAKGRTSQQWLALVNKNYPNARISQEKGPWGKIYATLSDGRKLVWAPVKPDFMEKDVAENSPYDFIKPGAMVKFGMWNKPQEHKTGRVVKMADGIVTVNIDGGKTVDLYLANKSLHISPARESNQGVAEGNDDPMNYNAAITGSYYESADPLARIKELALRK